MHMTLLIGLTVAIYLIFKYGLKGTVFEISWRRKSFAGVFIGREVFLLIILGVFLFEIFGLDQFVTFFITEASIGPTSLFILYACLLLLISISIFCRSIFRSYLLAKRWDVAKESDQRNELLLTDLIAVVLVCEIVTLHLLGVQNAFFQNIVSGQDLMQVRLGNRYQSSAPTFLISFLRFLYCFLAVMYGLNFKRLSLIRRLVYFSLVFYGASMPGDKAAVVLALVLLFTAAMTQSNKVSMRSAVRYSLQFSIVTFILVFTVAKIQFPEMGFEEFFIFILNRLGAGQIQGVYEQFALQLRDFEYIWHTVPFANFLVDAPAFNKDLMMQTWGVNIGAEETGVFNSFFIGEALAIGGYLLVIFSPIIVAFNYCLFASSVFFVFDRFFGISRSRSRFVVQLLVPSLAVFTGDIAGLLFFKIGVLVMVFFVPLVGLFRLFRPKYQLNKSFVLLPQMERKEMAKP